MTADGYGWTPELLMLEGRTPGPSFAKRIRRSEVPIVSKIRR
jgi:hypothetical protein